MNVCTQAVDVRPSMSPNSEAAGKRVIEFIMEITIQWDGYHA